MGSLRSYIVSIAALFALSFPAMAVSVQHDRAVHDAREFLQLLDQALLEEAWQRTAPSFQIMRDKNLWFRQTRTIRQTYGRLNTRELRATSLRKTYRNVPDGDYSIVQFSSVFVNKSKGVETLVLQCTSDGGCTVVDYVIN